MSYTIKRADRASKAGLAVGQTVYDGSCDYGCAADDTADTGIEHIAVSINENGSPFFTIPREDLEPVRTPYIGFTSDTLAKAPRAKAGDIIQCKRCGDKHVLESAKDARTGEPCDILMFYKCGNTCYVGAVQGRLIGKPDVSGAL